MIKTGLAPQWTVRFKREYGYKTFKTYGQPDGPLISKLSVIKEAKADLARTHGFLEIEEIYPTGTPICYQCDKPVNWLAPDSRCKDCTHLTPEEL